MIGFQEYAAEVLLLLSQPALDSWFRFFDWMKVNWSVLHFESLPQVGTNRWRIRTNIEGDLVDDKGELE
jgi:hypothetical protein